MEANGNKKENVNIICTFSGSFAICFKTINGVLFFTLFIITIFIHQIVMYKYTIAFNTLYNICFLNLNVELT